MAAREESAGSERRYGGEREKGKRRLKVGSREVRLTVPEAHDVVGNSSLLKQ